VIHTNTKPPALRRRPCVLILPEKVSSAKIMTKAGPLSSAVSLTSEQLAERIRAEAHRIGFDLVGFAPAVTPGTAPFLESWLDAGHAGEMHYFERRRPAYRDLTRILRNVRSVIMLALNYHAVPATNSDSSSPGGKVSRYAWANVDYHDTLKTRLAQLADVLHELHPGCRTRGVVDTAPLLERDFARLAGLGWFGKNTMLINKKAGSWLFLAALLTDIELPADEPHATSHCGTCTRCLEACPTNAFDAPYVLDARKCISYLTIELRDHPIPEPLRSGMGEWAFGCDVCQDVCPWNRKAPATIDPQFQPAPGRERLNLQHLLSLTEVMFQAEYGQTPFARPGLNALLRNVLIATGNTGTAADVSHLAAAAQRSDEMVREAAIWAMSRLRERLAESAG
jgi:epoxyqueuosine reductase